jgi:hypothetical protein
MWPDGFQSDQGKGPAMKVIEVRLDRDRLLTLPTPERIFFLALGHVTNEVNAITKILYWAANGPTAIEAEANGCESLILLQVCLLAGKLSEAWQLLQTNFFGNRLSQTYEPRLTGEPADALRRIKAYFSSKNAAHQIRNRFAFHFSPSEVDAMLSGMDEQVPIYLDRESAPNNLYYLSEALLARALIALVRDDTKVTTLDELAGDLFDVSAWFVTAADGIMDLIIGTHGGELRASEPKEVTFEKLRDFRDIILPWFTNTEGIVKAATEST